MTNPITTSSSILASLRALIPRRNCAFSEALNIAERQAIRLGELIAALDPEADGVNLHHIEGLPRLRVVFERLPVSGMSHWNGQDWIIAIARDDSPARQRFTLLHEFKHIIDHGHTARLYRGSGGRSTTEQAEAAADFFAGCALVPRRELKSAWGRGIQRVEHLVDLFGVSELAIRVRLAQTGLDRGADNVPTPRCARPISTPTNKPSGSGLLGRTTHVGDTPNHATP